MVDHIKNRPKSTGNGANWAPADVILPDPNLIEKTSRWRINFRQLEPGPMQTRVRSLGGQMLTLLEISMDRAVHQQGAAPPDTLTFGIPLGRDDLRWQNVDVYGQRFLTFGGSDGFEGISGSGFHGITFSVAKDQIEALAERLGMSFDDALYSSGVFLAAEQAFGTQPLAAHALNYLRPKGRAEISLSDEEEILTHFLYLADASEQFSDCSTGTQRARALRVSLEIMEANVAENVQISTICAMSGVSLRTLNRAYREAFGIGPKAYFLRMRLGILRRELLETRPGSLVSDLANPLGFWHMGQLARDYRAIFGELPSDTIV